eukprot:TRINITY_DN1542_c0_g1_i1.p1 TRINITY_DN1542_c0_g1~~TRINITY_DN1542_c0_g1_i1.p1  ORF type:complete len:396 (+),score=165.44 TRINITY_DN1542_c0_g1_i1:54-1241(+)
MWRPAFRRFALGTAGVTGGYALNEWRNECEACSLGCAVGSAVCAVGTLGMALKMLQQGVLQELEEGMRMLFERTSVGDPGAALCVAGVEYVQHGMDAALPVLKDADSVDCKVLTALALLHQDKAAAEKLLMDAANDLKEEVALVQKEAAMQGQMAAPVRPPLPPGVVPEPSLDESHQQMCRNAGLPYATVMLAATAARALDLPEGSLSYQAEGALLYVCAVRGFSPFYYRLARRAEHDRQPKEAATLYFKCLASVSADTNRYISLCLEKPARPNGSDAARNQAIAAFLGAIISSQISLCRLHEQGAEPEVAELNDEDGKKVLAQAVGGCQDLYGAVKGYFPEHPVIEKFPASFEHCKKAYNAAEKNSRDLQLCSEYFNVLVDHLDMAAKETAQGA